MEERDAEFLRSLRSGHPSAFAEVVKEFTPGLRRMAMGYFRSPYEQEDAVQEAFVHLYKQRLEIDPLRGAAFAGFFRTLARRKMIDLFRVRRPADELPSEDPAEQSGPEQDATARELKALMMDFEERLKPGFRSFFRRVFVDGDDETLAREALGIGRLRAKYMKKVLLGRLRQHRPLLEFLGRHPDGAPR